MRYLFLLLFLPGITHAQFYDDFNDGNFSQPLWMGDTASFTVVNSMLQLTSSGSATSTLLYTRPQSGNQEHEWSFRLKTAFAPSSQNYTRYYFFADSLSASNSSFALYLQIGETGSNDAPELKLINNGSTSVIARGINGSIAAAADLTYTLQCDSNYYWSLWTKDTGGNSTLQFVTQAQITGNTNIAGLQCTYTSSNADNFFLDDAYDGGVRYDTLPPMILSGLAVSNDSLLVGWNEAIDLSGATFTLNGDPVNQFVTAGLTKVQLYFNTGFVSGQVNTLRAYQVADIHGNIKVVDSVQFTYIDVVPAFPGAVKINELMPDPDNANQLPEAEYIELFNTTNKYLLLDSLQLSDGTSTARILKDTLLPGGFNIYSSSTGAISLKHFGIDAVSLSSFPSLNNDGDTIRLLQANGNMLDQVAYTTATYQHSIKSSGGWSLERIDTAYPCEAENNWKASEDFSGGTPGRTNSVAGNYQDTEAPCLLYAWMPDSMHIQLHFSEAPEPMYVTQSNSYTVSNGIAIDTVACLNARTYLIRLVNAIGQGEVIVITAAADLADCSGNTLGNCNTATTGLARSPAPGELLINEVLFNPYPNAFDFLEILNTSDKIIALDSVRLAGKDKNDDLQNFTIIHAGGRCILPKEIIAFTIEPDLLMQNYPQGKKRQLLAQELPSMNDDEGTICLLDPATMLIDELRYKEEMHHLLLQSTEGVSLERISVLASSNDSLNWHSASSQIGYATPGYKNSQAAASFESEGMLELPFPLFSPDNDGEKDALPIQVNFDRYGYSIHLAVYSAEGLPVRKLAENDLSSTTATYFWDGVDENRLVCRPGIYIILAEAIHPQGIRKTAKKACVLARRF
jgi:hypothetical protein